MASIAEHLKSELRKSGYDAQLDLLEALEIAEVVMIALYDHLQIEESQATRTILAIEEVRSFISDATTELGG